MYEVSCVGGSKVDAAAAIRQASRPQVTVKNQMMRLLRRSKSLARPPQTNNYHQHHNNNHRMSHTHDTQPPPLSKHVQVDRNGAVVAIVDVLPFVVGTKNKKKVFKFSHFMYKNKIQCLLNVIVLFPHERLKLKFLFKQTKALDFSSIISLFACKRQNKYTMKAYHFISILFTYNNFLRVSYFSTYLFTYTSRKGVCFHP